MTDKEKLWLKHHDGKIRIAPDPYWPPIEYFDGAGQYRGVSADYVNILKKKLGVEFQIVKYRDWNEVLKMAQDRQVDVLAGVTYSPKRSEYLNFTEPYIEIPCIIITRGESQYQSLEDLTGKKVAVGAGYVTQEYLRTNYPDLDIVPVADIKAGLRKVSFAEVDALMANIASVSYFIEKEGITNLKIAGETSYSVALSVASRNDLPILNGILQKALASITARQRDEIYHKWIRLDYQQFYKQHVFWFFVTSTLLIIISLLGIIFSWNLTLKHQVNLRTKEIQDNLNFRTALIETFPNPIYYKDIDGRYIGCNEAFARNIIGASKEEVIGKTFFDFIESVPADYVQRFHESDLEILKNPANQMFEAPLICGDGALRYFIFSKGTFADAYGQIRGIVGILIDVTDLKAAERALQESEKRYAMVVKQSSQLIYDYDVRTGELFWAGAIPQVTGYEPEEFADMNIKKWEENVHPDDRKETVAKLERARLEVGKFHAEYRFRRKDGSYVYIEEDGVYLPDESGVAVRMVGAMKDIDDRKRSETQKEQLLRSLAAKNKELESIVFVSSHDLRSPLVNIEGHSGELEISCNDLRNLLSDVELPEEKKRILNFLINEDIPASLRFITSGTKKMVELLNGLLRLCRLGIASLEIKEINVNNVLQGIVEAVTYQMESLNIKIEVGDLPSCYADESKINQVFSNLIDNAIKYRSKDRDTVIKITGWKEKDESVYCFEDNGVGIAPEYQTKVFEIFHRLNPTGLVQGEGLGLTIVRRIIDRLNGKVWVESEQGKGSKFYVSLPNKPTEIEGQQMFS